MTDEQKSTNQLIEFLHDFDGALSSKRLITFLSFILMGIAFLCNLFFGWKVAEFMYDAMMYITLSGFGVITAENWISKK